MWRLLKITCILLLLASKVISQTYSSNDAQAWFNLYLEKKIGKKFLIHLNQEDRWTNNVSQYNFGYADIGITYKLTKDIKILADYVFTKKRMNIQDENMDHYYGTIHQSYIAATIKKDIRRWRFMYRAMYQFQYNNPYTSYNWQIPQQYFRNKFIIKYFYNKRYTFYVADELYTPLNTSNVKGFDRNRTFAGLFYTLMKGHQIEFYFLYQNNLQKANWNTQDTHHNQYKYMLEKDFIYGIGYSIEF